MWKIELREQAEKDYHYWQKHNPRHFKKINQLLKSIQNNPFDGIGKPKPLQHNLQNYWSRRISEEHRILYEIIDDTVLILNCRGHYK